MMNNPAVAIAREAARAAGAIQRERFNTPLSIRMKGEVDLVTEVDLASEEAIRGVLSRLASGQAILGEEGGQTGSGDYTWIVDPLDGTTNFAHAVPIFCVSIALLEKGKLTAGVVFDPLRDELFAASAGEGATLNNQPIHVTTRQDLNSCLLSTGFAYDYRTSERHNFDAFTAMTRASRGVRRLGAAALDLAYVAAGRFDGFWELGLKPWDTAAGTLLIREAGGLVTTLSGEFYDPNTPDIMASNSKIHDQMGKILGRFF